MLNREILKKDIVSRLKKIEGQTRGIQKMVEEDRECENILTQLAAVRSAIERAGALVLKNYIAFCLAKAGLNQVDEVDSLARALAIWGRVRPGE
jgi:CsoR family transcriptional regulator, copper-sensing transcriptional repressor